MYLKSIRIQGLRRIRKLHIDLATGDAPRMWTVLIGENGTGKSSVLQAIALAAAGV
jgi:predicted ATP-dependent endonuclease of OLD family